MYILYDIKYRHMSAPYPHIPAPGGLSVPPEISETGVSEISRVAGKPRAGYKQPYQGNQP